MRFKKMRKPGLGAVKKPGLRIKKIILKKMRKPGSGPAKPCLRISQKMRKHVRLTFWVFRVSISDLL